MIRILIVDDEPQIRNALRMNLQAREYETIEAEDGRGALRIAADRNPDLVLLDLGLPDRDGLDVLKSLRTWTNVPVIVLTVRDDERDKVAALDAGADDYVTKPFGINELLARVRAALRRTIDENEPLTTVETKAFSLDLASKRGRLVSGEEVHLTPTEWAIVTHLGSHPSLLITARQLITAAWGPAYTPDANLLRVHLNKIRAKLEPIPSRPCHFLTEPGLGYRFEP